MNRIILAHAWRSNRLRLLAVAAGLGIWGFLMPVIYATFGAEFRRLIQGNPMFEQFSNFGGGDVFSLPGAIALGLIHPIAVALISVFAVGYAASCVAGERQRGTLEVLLARPVSRRALAVTFLVAAIAFVGVGVAAYAAGSLISASLWGVIGEVQLQNVPLLWLNAVLLFVSFAAIGLAASVSFDRVAPALGITLAVVVISYFLEILGSLWPDAEALQPYSLFHYVAAKRVLEDGLQVLDAGLLAAVALAAAAAALAIFRRDIAAPS